MRKTRRNIKGAGLDWYLKGKHIHPSGDALDQRVNARKTKKGSQTSQSIRHKFGQFVKYMKPRHDARVHIKDEVGIDPDQIRIDMGENGGRKMRKMRKMRKSQKNKHDEIASAEVAIMMGENGGRKSRKRRTYKK